jgi:succinoglycan biosynthesis transport protein ExoP
MKAAIPETEAPEEDVSQKLSLLAGILRRRRWFIAGTTFVVAFGTILVLYYLPNRYTSEATLLVIGQQVPERYVTPTATSDINEAMTAMVQEVLSRPGLRALIDELNLYPKRRKRLAPEQLIDLMRRDVSITPFENTPGAKDLNAFRISYIAETPQLAQRVTSRLTTVFIEQNLRTRANHATTTTSFLHDQLEIARETLTQQEQRLRDYKMQFLGELPEQQQGNLGILSGLQTQLENVMSGRNRAEQQRLYLESLLSEYRRTSAVTAGGGDLTPLQAARRDLARMQAEKRTLLQTYNPQYPDVRQKEREIRRQEAFVRSLSGEGNLAPDKQQTTGQITPQVTTETAQENDHGPVAAQLKSQLDANAFEIDNLKKQELRLRTQIDEYQSRLNMTPLREQQLTSMQRDYELLRLHYGDLLKKEQESQLATSLEKQQEGQQFRLADPANLPTLPSSPKRVKISLGGILAGLVLGCALALGAEAKDSSFHTEADVNRRLALPFVIGMPTVLTKAQVRHRSLKSALEWSAGSVMLLALSIAELYFYRRG